MPSAEPPPAIAIILARAGSKGLPGKNIAPLAGKPCVQWTIEHAKASRRVGLVAVSSDDPRVLSIARECGATPIERPPHLASDTARVDDAARHALSRIESTPSLRPFVSSSLAILYANVPVRPADLIDRALSLLASTGCDSVQSYSPVGKHHPWWTARLDDAGRVCAWEGDVLNHGVYRRQDLPPAVIPDGGVIALTRGSLMLEIPGVPDGPHAFFGKDRRGVVNPEGSVIDIDSRVDQFVADAVLKEGATPR